MKNRQWVAALTLTFLATAFLGACASTGGPYTTEREKTAKGAGIGAVAGATVAILEGKREADEILAGAAIGAVLGGGIGAYMDAQEERLTRIPGTTVERVGPETLLVHFDSDVLFDVDSAILDRSAQSALDEMSRVLNEFPKTAIIVQGHTSDEGSEAHNQELSERRAEAVRNFLIGRGVEPARMTAVGYGESAPRVANDSEYGRQLNRRVDILLRGRAR